MEEKKMLDEMKKKLEVVFIERESGSVTGLSARVSRNGLSNW